MPVSFEGKTANEYFGITQLPGGRVARNEMPSEMYEYASRAKLRTPAAETGGSWLIVYDGNTLIREAGHHPVHISGDIGPNETAHLGILNFSETANRSFRVSSDPQMDGWRTVVDGEVVETGEFHPHTIWWESAAQKSGFEFGFGGAGGNGGLL